MIIFRFIPALFYLCFVTLNLSQVYGAQDERLRKLERQKALGDRDCLIQNMMELIRSGLQPSLSDHLDFAITNKGRFDHEQLKQQVSHSDFVTHTARGRALSLRVFVDELLQKHAQEDNRYVAKASALIEPLTDREQQILSLIVAGKTNREIADTLTVAIGTVKTHAHNLYSKLGVKNRTQATRRAYDLNLV